VFKYPVNTDDTVLYEQIATNWLKHHVMRWTSRSGYAGDLRMPGYPHFSQSSTPSPAAREAMREVVMMAQIRSICLLSGNCSLAEFWRAGEGVRTNRRVRTLALWPRIVSFTANYTAVPLTEVFAVF